MIRSGVKSGRGVIRTAEIVKFFSLRNPQTGMDDFIRFRNDRILR